jgi:hypothetical protein
MGEHDDGESGYQKSMKFERRRLVKVNDIRLPCRPLIGMSVGHTLADAPHRAVAASGVNTRPIVRNIRLVEYGHLMTALGEGGNQVVEIGFEPADQAALIVNDEDPQTKSLQTELADLW